MAEVIRHEERFRPSGRPYWAPVIKCRCGKEVVCAGFTNTCECGADYNNFGSLLTPRSQWGEETGESLSDILSIQ